LATDFFPTGACMRHLASFAAPLLVGAALLFSSRVLAADSKPKHTKIAVLDVKAVGAFDPKTVAGLSTFIASEATRYPVTVIAGGDLAALIGFDKQRQILGCADSGCLAELGGALGVDFLLATEVSEVGGTWLLSMSLLDVAKAQATKRVTKRSKKIAEMVDIAAIAVEEVFARFNAPAKAAVEQQPTPPPKPLEAKPVEPQPKAAPAEAASPSTTVEKAAGTSSTRVVGFVLDGLGVALLAAGGTFGYLANRNANEAEALMNGTDRSSQAQTSFNDFKGKAKTRALIADVCYGVGAVALGVGLYFTIAGGSSSPAAVTVAPVAHGGALVVTGGF
jgi:hypothetical protein